MSHGRESEIQGRRLAKFKDQEFSKGNAKDHAQADSRRLEQYRERLQRAFTG